MIASPCVKVCVLDAERRYCTGCGRTLDEIARWSEMTQAERSRVIARLAAQRAARSLRDEPLRPRRRHRPARAR